MSNPNPNEDTEWNDALRKHGILPPKTPPPKTPSPPPSPTLAQKLFDKTTDEIDELLLEAEDSETERMILKFRDQRMSEIKKEEKLGRFGEIYPISREDYTREVSDASKVDDDKDEEPGAGTGVVCFLYKPGQHAPSVRLSEQLKTLAARYPRTKFTSIVGDKCIPNYPDRMLPTLILYRQGKIVEQLVAWGAKTEGTIHEIEAVLIQDGILKVPKIALPREPAKSKEDDDSENEGPKKKSGIRNSSRKDDSDSDFDL